MLSLAGLASSEPGILSGPTFKIDCAQFPKLRPVSPDLSTSPPTKAPGLAGIALLAFWAGLAAGVGEVTLRLIARPILSVPVFFDPASIWLAPSSAAILFLPCVLVAWLFGRLKSRRAGWEFAVAAAAFLATLDVLLLLPRMHALALVLVAAGIASQVARLAHKKPQLFLRLVRGSTALLAAVVVTGGIATSAWSSWSARRGLSFTPPVSPEPPSVLLLVLDTVRALELSAYGFERATSPQLAKLAREGVRFDRAVANAPWTLPTHATLFTGHYQRDLSVGWTTPLDSTYPTLAERFSASGYATGGFIANLRYCSREYGLARGFQTYRDYALVPTAWVGSTGIGRRVLGMYNDLFNRYLIVGRKDGRRVVDEFLSWHEDLGGRPYFAFLNFFDAHEPYAPAAPYDLMFSSGEPPTRAIKAGERYTKEEVQGLREAYGGAIASLDADLGRLFDELGRNGTLDRTLVIVTSDHGEEFDEHGHLSHGNGLHFPSLHVPLIVRWPGGGIPADYRVETPVSLRDLPATILDLALARPDSAIPGHSLAPLWWGNGDAARSPVLSELYWAPNQAPWYPIHGGNMRSLVRGRYHLIAGPGDHEELYDIAGDPFEERNLVTEAALTDTLVSLRAALAEFPMPDRGGR